MSHRHRPTDAEVDRELRSHLELEAEEQCANGLTSEDAALAARRAFGKSTRIAEEIREVWSRRWLDRVVQDVRFAGRLLARNWGFAAGAVIPLAFAIGCTACVLTLVDAVLFRPLGLKNPDRVAAVYAFSRQKGTFLSSSYPDFRDLESLGNLIESATAFVRMPVNVRFSDATERMNSEMVTAGYHRTLGITPVFGRGFVESDHQPDAVPVTLVSYAIWESRFAKSTSALGSTVWIAGTAFTVIGVMPPGYAGTLMDWYAGPSFWIPLSKVRQVLPMLRAFDYENMRSMQWLMMVARMRSGVEAEQLQAALNIAVGREPRSGNVSFLALPPNQARFFPGHRPATVRLLWVLVGVAVAALVIACFNLAGLLVARASSRQREMGTRLALGAGRLRLLHQLLAENVLLAACACLLGLPVAAVLTRSTEAFRRAFGLSLDLSLDWRVLAASALAGVAAATAAGLVVAWRALRIDPAGAMKDSPPRSAFRHTRFGWRDAVVAAQVACAMTALVSASLLVRSLRDWGAEPLGYNPRGILLASLDMLSAGLRDRETEAVLRRLLAEVRSEAPGAALAAQAMPTRIRTTIDVAPGGGERWTPVDSNEVSDGYFELLQIPVLRGRAVSSGDDARARPVVVVNQAAASMLWPGELPLGRRLRLKGETADREVVGVVANSRYRPLGEVETARPVIFPPILQRLPQEVVLHVRPPVPPGRYEEPLRHVVGRVAAGLPLSGTETLDERVESGLARERLVAHAATMVGAVGVLLAIVGVFAAGAYRVAQGKREIAIRLSVGAGPGRIVRSHAARGVAISLCGSLAGVVSASWTAALLHTSLRGVGTPGFRLFAASGLALVATASLASWLAARRAAQIEPVVVLKVQ